jgi:hypothetical protein
VDDLPVWFLATSQNWKEKSQVFVCFLGRKKGFV